MNRKVLIIAGVVVTVAIAAVTWWRSRPVNRAERMLVKAAETASVSVEDNIIRRRVKAGKLREFAGDELHVDVEGIARSCDLMQDEALAAWAYAVGEKRYLSVEVLGVELISVDEDEITVNATISLDSDYAKGRYSKTYPVVIELVAAEKKLRVTSLKTRI